MRADRTLIAFRAAAIGSHSSTPVSFFGNTKDPRTTENRVAEMRERPCFTHQGLRYGHQTQIVKVRDSLHSISLN